MDDNEQPEQEQEQQQQQDQQIEQQQQQRRSVAKEQWKHFLEALQEAEEASSVVSSSVPAGDVDNAVDNKTVVTTGTTGDGTSTVAGDGTIVELANINQDLEDTAGNLADLEIEFEEDLQCLQMGFESAFNNSFNTLNTSFGTLLPTTTMDSSDHATGANGGEGGDELGPFSTRSYQTTASAALTIGDIGTSIRSIRHHARGLDSIKKDMENTMRKTLHEQRATGRRMSMGSVSVAIEEQFDDGIVMMELEPEMEEKFQNWFGRVWKHIEDLLEKRRQERQQQMAAQAQENHDQKFANDSSDNSNNTSSSRNNSNGGGGRSNSPIPQYQPQKKAAGMGLFHVKAVPNNPDMIEVNGSLYTHQEFKRLLRDLNNQM